MARVVIFKATVEVQSGLLARRAVRDLLSDVRLTARARVLGGTYSTGRLAASIKTRQETLSQGEQGTVYSDLHYANAVENGAVRHVILPRGDYPLHFYWRKVGRIVDLAVVNHPGQKGKHYLRDALVLNAPRHGFRVEIH